MLWWVVGCLLVVWSMPCGLAVLCFCVFVICRLLFIVFVNVLYAIHAAIIRRLFLKASMRAIAELTT